MISIEPLLRADRVSWTVNRRPILIDVDLHVPAGARHALLGHNGAGKTTLLNLITGQLSPTSGRIQYAGHDTTGWRPHRLARAGIARTWQHPGLCEHLTVQQNLDLARPAGIPADQTARLLVGTGLNRYRDRIVALLPYGLRRRVELAVALAARPRLLILDEPSAGLSPGEITDLITLLSNLDPALTLLFTDHNPRIVQALATGTTELHEGRNAALTPQKVTDLARVVKRPQAARTHPHRPMLTVRKLSAGYDGAPVLVDVDLRVHAGALVAVIGPNGAGKTTLLNTIAGLLPQKHREGTIHIGTQAVQYLSAARRRQLGVSIVPQERHIFGGLTVEQQLAIPPRRDGKADLLGPPEYLFPALAGRLQQQAGSLSGGEQQMLAFARAVAGQPSVLLLDEPFEGLASDVVTLLSDMIGQLADRGVAVLIADHDLGHLANLASTVVDLSVLTGSEAESIRKASRRPRN